MRDIQGAGCNRRRIDILVGQRVCHEDFRDMVMIEKALLTKRKYSRPGILRRETDGIVMHYTASPGATAKNIRDYFERTKRYASAHYIVGIQGEILQVIPEDEKAYHCGAWIYKPGITDHLGPDPNMRTIGVEMCHRHHSGQFEKLTIYYARLLVGYLCDKYDLNPITETVLTIIRVFLC